MVSKSTLNRRRKKLVEALRSGEYAQGRLVLRSEDDEFCCLGVACEISGLFPADRDNSFSIYSYGDETTVLPEEVMNYFGFRTPNGEFYYEDDSTDWLSALNDNYKTFDEIADLIESRPKGLFVTP